MMRPERDPLYGEQLDWPEADGESLVGTVVPVPKDKHGRSMLIYRVESCLAKYWSREIEPASVRAYGRIISRAGDKTTSLTESIVVPLPDVLAADRPAIVEFYRVQLQHRREAVEAAIAKLAAVEDELSIKELT